jgi:O-antigen/teichoic acid export membrane protein
MVIVIVGFGQLFADMGMSSAIIHHQEVTENELSSLYWFNIFVGCCIFLLMIVSIPLIVGFYSEPRLKDLLILAAPIFLITPFGQQYEILLQKSLHFDRLASAHIVSTICNSLATVTFALLGFRVYSLVLGQLSGSLLKVLVLMLWGLKIYRPRWHFRHHDLGKYISFGLFQLGDKTINYFGSNLDYLLIGSLLGAKALGYYTLAWNLVLRPPMIINPIINRVAFPVFSIVQQDTDRLKRGYLKTLQLLSLVNFPLLIGICACASTLVPVFFGSQWMESVVLVQVLFLVGILRSVGNPVGSLLLAKGKAALGFKWSAYLVLGQVIGLYVGSKMGGVVGIAIAYALLMSLYSVLNYGVLIKTLLGSCLSNYMSSMIPALWMSIVMGAVMLIFASLFRNILQDGYLLVLQIIIGALTYSTLFFHSYKSLVYEMKNVAFPSRQNLL